MLQFIIGTSGTGKTTTLVDKIKEKINNNEKCVFIVPEQFSSTTEFSMFTKLGDAKSSKVFVYSFNAYCKRIEDTYGGAAKKTITDAGRVVLVRHAINQLSSDLQVYKKLAQNPFFCTMCADAIKELKIAGVAPKNLISLNANTKTETEKLNELGYIFAQYESILEDTGLDATDRIVLSAQKAGDEFFQDVNYFIDGFDGFTSPEYELLTRLILNGKSCTITLCTDSVYDKFFGIGLFSTVQKTINRLSDIATEGFVQIEKTIDLAKNTRDSSIGVRYIDKYIRGEAPKEKPTDNTVTLTKEPDRYSEVKTISAKIHSLAISGVQYSKISVLCRDIEMYKTEIEYVFDLYDIPYFCDANTDAEFSAPSVLIRGIISVLKEGITTKPILSILKSQLTEVDPQTISELENYAFVWGLKTADWKKPFDKDPSGITETMSQQDQETLQKLEGLRAYIVPILAKFRKEVKDQEAVDIIKAIYLLMVELKAEQTTLKKSDEFRLQNKPQQADDEIRMWDITVKLLDEISDMLAGEKVSPSELDDFFVLLLRSTEVGNLPRTRSQVVFGGADRTRLDGIEHTFILGLNEGVFPAQVGYSGLLSHSDRELLVQNGVDMVGSYENRILLEDMFLYRALTHSRKTLHLLCHTQDGAATVLPNTLFTALEETSVFKPIEMDFIDTVATKKVATEVLADSYRTGGQIAPTLVKALETEGEYTPILEKMQQTAQDNDFGIKQPKMLKELLGKELLLSPTRVEKYYNCRFAYFLKYILKVEARRKAEVSVMETGTFVHYILEKVIKQNAENFTVLKANDIKTMVDVIAQEYMETILKGVEKTARLEALIKRLCKNVVELLLFIQKEQQQSEFRPVDFELQIFENDKVKPLSFKTKDGQTVKIIGTVDRVDVYQNDVGDSYIRVMDYKTGDKKFSLEEVYNGINMQMLLYLFTLAQNAGNLYPNPKQAGVLYLLSDPSPTVSKKAEYEVVGLVLDDEDILSKMEKEKTGKFLPVSFTAKGSIKSTSLKNIADIEKLARIRTRVEELVVLMAEELSGGKIDATPILKNGQTACQYCDYQSVCRHQDGKKEQELLCPERVFEKPNTENDEKVVG